MQMKTTKITKTLVRQMVKEYKEGATLTVLSVNHKLGIPVVRSALVSAGVRIRPKGGSIPFDSQRAEKMAHLYEEEGQTYQEIGDQFGITRERVRQILRTHGVKSHGRRASPSEAEPAALSRKERQIAKLYDKGTRPGEIKEQFDISYAELQTILRKAGVPTKPKGFFNRRPNYDKIHRGVISDYKAGVDPGVIAERYGLCGRTEIYKFLNREGVPVHHRGTA
jgi:DNA-binding CsgD family transcriptional regulator